MKKFFPVTAAFVAAVAVLVIVALPPQRLALPTTTSDGTIPGIVHVHSSRSDGRGTPDEIAAAAAAEGLKFVVLTDHGDGTRKPDPPVYRSGVLCLDAVEISSNGGHYLALDMPAAPYPLGGEARDVVEDVRRLGGFGIVAHPDSPKPELGWRGWDTPFDAIEWVNPDTSWRVRARRTGWRARWRLFEALAAYPFRSAETMARLMAGTTLSADRWAEVAGRRRVVILGGADAHARLGLGGNDPGEPDFSLPLPGYRASFRAFAVYVRPESPLSGDAASDASALMSGLRRGHAYAVIRGLADPPTFEFTAANGRGTALAGDELSGEMPVTLSIRTNAPSSFSTVLWADKRVVASASSEVELTHRVEMPGVYRVEINASAGDEPAQWLISNPIYVGVTFRPKATSSERAIAKSHPLFDGRTSSGWWTESDPVSVAAVDVTPTVGGMSLRLRYGLSSESTPGPHVALATNIPPGESYDRVAFSVRGERPGRLEVELRVPGPGGDRWHRSVYIDQLDRKYTIAFDEMVPAGSTAAPHPVLENVRDVMFVLDTTHTKAGASGRIWLREPVLQK